jgi:hypothetical protein
MRRGFLLLVVLFLSLGPVEAAAQQGDAAVIYLPPGIRPTPTWSICARPA